MSRRLLILLVPAITAMAAEGDHADIQAQLDELRRANAQLDQRLDQLSHLGGGQAAGHLRLIDLSLDANVIAGTSTAEDGAIAELQGGGHDPQRRGFTVSNVELSFSGAVDPYLTAEAHLVTLIDAAGETGVELEEAFARTQALPAGLELKAGQFFTEFGRLNSTHPHAWTWIDQPVISSRIFGGDGMRGQGARLSWSLPTPWWSELLATAQNARGETMASFVSAPGEAVGGRLLGAHGTRNLGDVVYSARWNNAIDCSDDLTCRVGASLATGPNASGRDTRTTIYGAHLAFRWHPAGGERGWPFVTWETEVIGRDYQAGVFTDDPDGVPGNGDETTYSAGTLHDWGGFSQLMVGFHPGWAVGLRGDFATGSGDSVGGRRADPTRDDRYRISPLLMWQPSEFSRLRLQYDYDHAQHLDRDGEHSVWLGLEVLIGTHPPHVF
jgi:hypothetical protein